MSLRHVHMGAGSLRVSLSRPLPRSIRDRFTTWDQVVIGPPGLLEQITDDENRLAVVKKKGGSMWAITDLASPLEISGEGLSFYLGDVEGRGPMFDAPIVKASSTPSQWLDEVFDPDVWDITKGTVSGGTAFAGTSAGTSTALELVNWIAVTSGCEWVLNPDLTIDMAPAATLFPQPTVSAATVITRVAAGGAPDGVVGVDVTELQRARSAKTVIGRALVLHKRRGASSVLPAVESVQTPTFVRYKGLKGSAVSRHRARRVDGLTLTRAAAQKAADAIVEVESLEVRSVQLTSRAYNVHNRVRPGDFVYLWDPDEGYFDTDNALVFGDGEIFPELVRVYDLDVPICRGPLSGVFLRCDGGAEWIDISDYVSYEPDDQVSWTVTSTGAGVNGHPIRHGVVDIPTGEGGQSASRALIVSAGSEGGWTPTLTNWSTGTGTGAATVGDFVVHDADTLDMTVLSSIGDTGAGRGASGNPRILLPDGYQLRLPGTGVWELGTFRGVAAGVEFRGVVEAVSTELDRVRLRYVNAAALQASMSSTLPGAWATGDSLNVHVTGIPVELT